MRREEKKYIDFREYSRKFWNIVILFLESFRKNFLDITFCFLYITFCFLDITFCFLYITFCFLDITFCFLDITFCFLDITFCFLYITFLFLDINFSNFNILKESKLSKKLSDFFLKFLNVIR